MLLYCFYYKSCREFFCLPNHFISLAYIPPILFLPDFPVLISVNHHDIRGMCKIFFCLLVFLIITKSIPFRDIKNPKNIDWHWNTFLHHNKSFSPWYCQSQRETFIPAVISTDLRPLWWVMLPALFPRQPPKYTAHYALIFHRDVFYFPSGQQ